MSCWSHRRLGCSVGVQLHKAELEAAYGAGEQL